MNIEHRTILVHALGYSMIVYSIMRPTSAVGILSTFFPFLLAALVVRDIESSDTK